MQDNGGEHWLATAQIQRAFVRPQYWSGRVFQPQEERLTHAFALSNLYTSLYFVCKPAATVSELIVFHLEADVAPFLSFLGSGHLGAPGAPSPPEHSQEVPEYHTYVPPSVGS